MEIKDQLRIRLEQLKMSRPELARRVGVSNQTVAFWLEGRNLPGKRHLDALEAALSVKLDFSSKDAPLNAETVSSIMSRSDIELLIEIKKLPPEMRMHLLSAFASLGRHLAESEESIREDERLRVSQEIRDQERALATADLREEIRAEVRREELALLVQQLSIKVERDPVQAPTPAPSPARRAR